MKQKLNLIEIATKKKTRLNHVLKKINTQRYKKMIFMGKKCQKKKLYDKIRRKQ